MRDTDPIKGARIIEESGSGITCPAEDGEALASSILKLFNTPESGRISMGLSGKKYYEEEYRK